MRLKNRFKYTVVDKASTILTAKPFAYILKSAVRNERCDHCFNSDTLSKCSGCQYVYYCDRKCQKESWPIHKEECTNLKKISPKIMPDAARLMARVIIKLNHGGGEELGYYTETKYRKFKDLLSHYSDIKNSAKQMEHFTSLCGVLFEFFGKTPIPNSAELMGIYGRMCINSFNILNQDMNSIGVGIYLGPSILDHSCKPNAAAVFEGTTLIIRTLQDLPSLDWSNIRISYIDLLDSTKDRRAELQNSYHFLCECERCSKPEPEAQAAACPNISCPYPCSINNDECKYCATAYPAGFKEKFMEVSEFTTHHLQDMKNIAYLDVSKICLKRQAGVLHPLNVQHVKTLESAFDAAINLSNWEEAEKYSKKLLPGYLLYYGEVHPLTGLLYLMGGKIQLYLNKPKQAFDMLRKAYAVLVVTHGEKHSLVKDTVKRLLYQVTLEAN